MTDVFQTGTSADVPILEVRLLGGFAAAIDAVDVAAERWPSLRATHLVQLLCLQPRNRLTRDQVIDALWPQLEPEAGGANLRKALHHARQALGRHDSIAVQGSEVVLWPGRAPVIDAEVFERRAGVALASREQAACNAAAATYGGDLLPGARYEAWTEPARERLRARHLQLLRVGAQWERLARLEPTDEAAHCALMTAELAAGNRAAALRWYAHLRDALQHELGVLPGRDTEAVYERCIAGLQSAGPGFAGRAGVLAQVAAWLGMRADGRPGCIVLRGAAGIGKTALCRELGARAKARGWTVMRIDSTQTGHPYAAVTSIAESLILADRSVLDRVGAPARAVLALLTPLAAAAGTLPGPLGRHQVVGAVRRLILADSGGADVLVQVDDMHLLDDADVEVLVHLVTAGPPVCVLAAMRAPAAGSASARSISRLQRAGLLQQIDLEPLDEDETRGLIERAVPAPMAGALVARIIRTAAGNPFLALELARCAEADAEARLPASAAEAIMARLCDVSAPVLSLLQWLALAGEQFDAGLAEVLASEVHVLPFPALDAALAADVLTPAGTRYRFRHDLVRQALIEQIAPHRRLKMHRVIALRQTELDMPPASIARHLLDAGSARAAMPWLIAAARNAMRVAAFSDTLRHLEPVLAFQADHAEALRLRAEALDAQGDPTAMTAYRAAAAVAGEADSHDLRARAALAQVKQGDPKGALQALEGLQPVSVDGRLCVALAYSGAAALGVGDPATGTAKAAEARRLALQSGDTAALVIASWAQAAAAHARGELHQSVWNDLYETSHVPHLAMRVFDGQLCITQRFLYGARPYAEVIAFAHKLTSEAQRIGATRGYAFGITLRGEAELLSGDLQAAREHLREGARLHRAINGPTGEAFSLQRLAEVSLYEGRRDEARALIGEALDVARQTDVGFHLLDRIYGTRILLHSDDPAAALHALEDASASVRGPLETCPGCRITFAVPAAIAAARAGALDLALKHEEQCAYLANVVMRLPAWYAAHDEVRGHIAAARGSNGDDPAARFAAASARFREAGQPLDAARCDRLASEAVPRPR